MNDDVSVNETTSDAANDAAGEAAAMLPPEPVPEVEAVELRISAGAQLVALREARGWTVEYVANHLNLAARQIDALEHDNYAALPGMVIVRGFIRAYAKVLQADATPILAAIVGDSAPSNVLPPARSEMSASFSETQLLSDETRRGSPLKMIVGLVVLLMIAGVAVLTAQHMGWLPTTAGLFPAKTESELTHIALKRPAAAAPAVVAETPKAQAPQTAAKPPANPHAAEAAKTEHAETSAPAAASETKAVATAAAASETKAAAESKPAATASVPFNGKNALVIRVHQDSWVEIRRADDSILLSRLLQAGSAEAVDITSPVSVVIGNAAGVSLTLRGKPVDVSGNASNVARLDLK